MEFSLCNSNATVFLYAAEPRTTAGMAHRAQGGLWLGAGRYREQKTNANTASVLVWHTLHSNTPNSSLSYMCSIWNPAKLGLSGTIDTMTSLQYGAHVLDAQWQTWRANSWLFIIYRNVIVVRCAVRIETTSSHNCSNWKAHSAHSKWREGMRAVGKGKGHFLGRGRGVFSAFWQEIK
jgi:hypothetical protein